ncbi:MAG: response regulator [Deltaproteobacteria bacterium]|nr:response regulator [Deltaproteobacteria bacterium]
MTEPREKTILVVEDEPDVRAFISATLEDAGFQVATAANGLEAHNFVKEQKPDLVTLDLVMPRQSGVLFYKKLRTNPKWLDIPVLIVTAHARDDLGMDDFNELMKGKELPPPLGFLEKPVNPEALVRSVAQALGVDATGFPETPMNQTRNEILERLRSADGETLRKVQEMLNENRRKV